jgi:hypothetical protein
VLPDKSRLRYSRAFKEHKRLRIQVLGSKIYADHALHEAMRKFYIGKQDKSNKTQEYYQRFKNPVEVVEYCCVLVGNHEGLLENNS